MQLNKIKLLNKTHFSEELFSDTRLRQGPPAGVHVYVEDWIAAVNAVVGERNR